MESLTILPPSRLSLAMLKNLVGRLKMPHLQHFQIARIRSGIMVTHMPDTALFTLLAQRSPALSDLGVTLESFPRTLSSRRLDYSPRSQISEPELPTLLLRDLRVITEDDSLRDGLSLTFLRAHLNHGTKLRRFELVSRGAAPEICPDLDPFIDRGLEVSLKYVS
ncbi:hypothetical protein K438DRAFT_1957330 [Mycena galopus ATCC 62051]|nr:hypothetical protein K438DRAFT_1957330 [Mycena galopus ATCC 62051]